MSLINKSHVRKYILDRCQLQRPEWGCSQVSSKVLEEINQHIKDRIDRMVRQHPTLGRTFREVG